MANERVRAGFGKTAINGCFAEQAGYHDDLEARLLYLEQGERRCLLIAFDLVQPSRFICREIREALAGRLGMAPGEIITHATHTHTSPFDPEFRKVGLSPLINRLLEAVPGVIGGAAECRVGLVSADTLGRFNVNERKEVPGVGTFEVWFGYRVEGDRADGARVVRPRVEKLLGRKLEEGEFPEHLWYDRKVDSLAQLVSFQSFSGEPLGSLLRFSVHPVVSGHTGPGRWLYGADIPGFARAAVEEEMGGTCLYLSGPHGNITPLERVEWKANGEGGLVHALPEAPWSEARRIGRGIAGTVLEKQASLLYRPLEEFESRTRPVSLRLRDAGLVTAGDWHRKKESFQERLNAARERGVSLKELKELSELVDHYDFYDYFFNRYALLNGEEAARGRVECDLAAVRLNDIVLAGLPGEAFMETGEAVRAAFPDLPVITLTEIDGDIGYIPTSEEMAAGGYHAACSIIAPSEETVLRDAIVGLVGDIARK